MKNLEKTREKILSVAVLFAVLFYFKIPIIGNSLFFLGGLAIFSFYRYDKFLYSKQILLDKEMFFVNIIFVVPFCWYLISATVNGQGDYSLIWTLISYQVYITLLVFIICDYFFRLHNFNIESKICQAFFVQAIIIILAFLFSPFREFIQLFQSEGARDIAVMQQNIGIRGLALSSQQYFGLGVLYCIFFLFYMFFLTNKRIKFSSLFTFFLIFISAITIARTIFIGAVFATIYLLLVINKTITVKILIRMCILGCVGMFCFVYLYLYSDSQAIKNSMNWAFEIFFNIIDGNGANTASTTTLTNMYFPLNEDQILYGDGRYMDKGFYYMHTDAGYMRMLLAVGFGGGFWLLYDLLLIKILYNSLLGYKYRMRFCLCLLLLLLTLNVKGEVLGYNVGAHLLIFIFIIRGKILKKMDKIILPERVY